MSKFVNRIFKNKKTSSKTLDDIQATSSSKSDSKNTTLPRSKTTQLSVVNGRAPPSPSPVTSPRHNFNHHDSIAIDRSESKDLSIRSQPPRCPSPIGICMSPVEIPAEEALQLIAEEPPHVARCTPKGLVVDTARWKEEHDMQHCIYERAVYEKMIDNSLKTCELLQNHLDSYITVVRQTPSRETTPVKIDSTSDKKKA